MRNLNEVATNLSTTNFSGTNVKILDTISTNLSSTNITGTNVYVTSIITGANSNFNTLQVNNTINLSQNSYKYGGFNTMSIDVIKTNTYLGKNVGNNITGLNAATGCTLIGDSAGLAITTASNSTAVGSNSMMTTTTGKNNSALGTLSLFTNTIGSDNTAIGCYSLELNSGGINNTSVGSTSLVQTSGSNNTAIGYLSGYSNTSGNGNIFIGANAGNSLPTTDSNILCVSNNSSSNIIYGDMLNNRIGLLYTVGTEPPLTHDISIDGQSNRTIGLERNTIISATGSSLSIEAGGSNIGSSNTYGGNLYLQSGIFTGTGASSIILQVPNPFTFQGATIDAPIIDKFIVPSPVLFSLTSGITTVVPLFIVMLPNNSQAAGTFELSVLVNNGIDFSTFQDRYSYVANNKAGTITRNSTNVNSISLSTVGALTCTMNLITGVGNITISISVRSNLAGTIRSCAHLIINNASSQAIIIDR